jgi:NAD(P)-dependent dehydrogenase (short-subunit alcohol dehydrogenase family)
MINLTRSMAIAYAAENIRVNTLSPGFTDTTLIAPALNVHDEAIKPILSPMKRAGLPEEMAAALLFLSSDECRFCTGTNLVVDGGQSCKYFG